MYILEQLHTFFPGATVFLSLTFLFPVGKNSYCYERVKEYAIEF